MSQADICYGFVWVQKNIGTISHLFTQNLAFVILATFGLTQLLYTEPLLDIFDDVGCLTWQVAIHHYSPQCEDV